MTQRRGGFLTLSLIGACVALTFSISRACIGQVSEIELPKGAGPLPDLSKGAKAGAVVTSQHSHLYRMLLPAEVAPLLDQGELAFEAVRAPREPGRYVMPRMSSAVLSSVVSSGVIADTAGGKALISPMFDPPQTPSGDLLQMAYKILWNSASTMWRYNSFASSLSVLIFKTAEDAPHKLEFDVERVYPRKLGEVVGTLEPIFRERISARKPAAIQNLSWLTLRFFGSGEDFVWAASPVINQIRQMTGSNRSDAMFSGVFSPDDLFVWSGKVELVEPSGLALMPLLVPMLEVPAAKAEARGDCLKSSFKGDAAIALSHTAGRFKGSGSWVPTNTFMALRAVWRMDLSSRDPFSLDTRQTLYVDRDTGLPVYRVVWDDAGRLRKVTIGIISSLEREGAPAEPFIAGQIMVIGTGRSRLVITFDTLTACARYPTDRTRSDFDPSTFVKFAPQPQNAQKLQKKPERDVDSEDSLD